MTLRAKQVTLQAKWTLQAKPQNENPTKFRDHFSKPRRFATRTEEIRRLKESLKNKEIDPIEQYISRCENKNLKKFIGIKDEEVVLTKERK